MTTFDRNQIKEYIAGVEDDCAEFIGAEFCAARIIGNLARQHEVGELGNEQVRQLVDDAHHLLRLAKLGHRYAKLARNPSPELRIMILADEQRERRPA